VDEWRGSALKAAVVGYLGDSSLKRRLLSGSSRAFGGQFGGWMAISLVQEITAETFRGFQDIRMITLLGSLTTGGKSGEEDALIWTRYLLDESLWLRRSKRTCAKNLRIILKLSREAY
jgi:hypothetical protein